MEYGRLLTKTHSKGGAYSEGGAYWKEGAKSIMVAPTEDLVLIVVQLIEKIPERVHGAAFD